MKLIKFLITSFIFLYFNTSCAQQDDQKQTSETITKPQIRFDQFTRDGITKKLKNKIDSSIPLVIHVFVPLCDNDNQGIVKVGGKLGDGRNLRTNLYWGAGYGLKTYFTRSKDWKFLKNSLDIDSAILERVIFSRVYPNKAKVFLILDGYAGDKMEECLNNYFKSLAGILNDSIFVDTLKIPAFGISDFLVFNGHNGLMDKDFPIYYNIDNIEKDAAVIACLSYTYFIYRLEQLKAYPLITTTSLLPPEAYVISAIIDNWATLQTEENIRKSAGEAMARVHKLASNTCINMFSTGW